MKKMCKKGGKPVGLRKWLIPLAGILYLLAVTVSCTTMQVNGLATGPTSSEQQIVGTFEKKVWVHKALGVAGGPTLFNLFSDVSDAKIQDIIRQEVQAKGGTGAKDIQIQWGAGFGQLLLNMITGCIYAPSTVTVRGTVIKDN
jgi:hypothetical protein